MNPPSPSGPASVLLVDEQPESGRQIRAHLEQWGHEVTATQPGAEALAQFAKRDFDLVVADVALSERDGKQLLEATRRKRPVTPLIVLSSRSQVDAIVAAIRQGAFDYVIEDDSLVPLQSAVRRAIDHVRLLSENTALLADLHAANAELEQRVQQPTQQLELANQRLTAERGELKRALHTLEDTQTQLVQAGKMASLGLLTAGVAHEINNPLGFVLPNFAILEQWCEATQRPDGHSDDSAGEMLAVVSESREGLLRIRDIVQELGLFARRSPTANERVNLTRVIHSVCRLFGGQLRYRNLLRPEATDVPDVRADAGQLRQVVLNLLINAAHAIPQSNKDGCIVVRNRQVGDLVEIDVSDNGVGIPPHILSKVFDPFFTTKPVGKGTGMGLAISRQLVARMGGEMRIASEVDHGTTVTIQLGIWQSEAEPGDPRAGVEAPLES